jgi:hypothetical protein
VAPDPMGKGRILVRSRQKPACDRDDRARRAVEWRIFRKRAHQARSGAQAEAFIRLSETIGLWRAESGRSLEIRLLPDAAATLAANENAKCQYRLVPPIGEPTDWKVGRARSKPGGVFLVVQGVKVNEEIQVKILEGDSPRWRSVESPQWVHIELKSVQ